MSGGVLVLGLGLELLELLRAGVAVRVEFLEGIEGMRRERSEWWRPCK